MIKCFKKVKAHKLIRSQNNVCTARSPAAATEALMRAALSDSGFPTLHALGTEEHCWERFGLSPGPKQPMT